MNESKMLFFVCNSDWRVYISEEAKKNVIS